MRVYLQRKPGGWEIGDGICYECPLCGGFIRTDDENSPWECRCGNLYIDYSYGRIGARERESDVRMFREAAGA